MTLLTAQSPMNRQKAHRPDEPETCGGAQVLDLALCLILAVAVTGLLVLAL